MEANEPIELRVTVSWDTYCMLSEAAKNRGMVVDEAVKAALDVLVFLEAGKGYLILADDVNEALKVSGNKIVGETIPWPDNAVPELD